MEDLVRHPSLLSLVIVIAMVIKGAILFAVFQWVLKPLDRAVAEEEERN